MAVIDGALGNAVVVGSFAATIINIFEWSANIDNAFVDRRIFGVASDSIQEHRMPYQIIGSLSGDWDNSVGAILVESWFAPLATASTTLTLTAFTGRTWVFPAHMHNFSPKVNRRSGLNGFTCAFRSDGDVTFA